MQPREHTAGVWFHEPRQERSQETLDRLLGALAELLAEQDFDEISVADIAARADRTVGSFYGRFDDKDAALYALHVRELADDREHVAKLFAPEAVAHLDLEATVRQLVAVLVGAYVNPRPWFREVVLRSAQAPAFLEQCAEMARFVGECWTTALESKSSEVECDDPTAAAARSYRVVLAVLNQLLLFGPFVPPYTESTDDLTDDLTGTALCLLRGRGTAVR